MLFVGISRAFSLLAEGQYNTIGAFWDEMSELYGMENLHGLGYKWENGKIYYAIGLKDAEIEHSNFRVELPDDKWETVEGETENLKSIYDVLYRSGPLKYEIETFDTDGKCRIMYYR